MSVHTHPEMFWLLLVTMLTGVLWMPYIVRLIAQLGMVAAIWDPVAAHPHKANWALRAKKAHYNAVENLVVFAPLVLMIEILGVSNGVTALAAMIYFFARLTHFTVFLFAVPVVRTVAFMAGFGCQAVMAARVLGLV